MFNAVMISSAIHTVSTPLNYTSVRSFFSHQDRFDQTLRTIQSIRSKIPNSYIILIEGTQLSNEFREKLLVLVDHLHEGYNIDYVSNYVNSLFKGKGEASSIHSYLLSDHFKQTRNVFVTLSKISGRYRLKDTFQFITPINSILGFISYTNPHHPSKIHLNTAFYTVSFELYDTFKDALDRCLNDTEWTDAALEHVLPLSLIYYGVEFTNKTPLDVEGEYGTCGNYYFA